MIGSQASEEDRQYRPWETYECGHTSAEEWCKTWSKRTQTKAREGYLFSVVLALPLMLALACSTNSANLNVLGWTVQINFQQKLTKTFLADDKNLCSGINAQEQHKGKKA